MLRATPVYVEMIRVLHFAHILNRSDFVHSVLENCDPDEFAMRAATLSARGSLNALPGGIHVTDFAVSTRLGYPRVILGLRRLVQRERIQVLHAHHYEPTTLAFLATRRLPVQLVVGRHYSDSLYQLSRGLRRRAYLALEGLSNRAAAAIVVPSLAVESILREQGVPPGKVVRIPYAVAFERFRRPPERALRSLQELWGAAGRLRLATFARIHQEKGHRYLLEAINKLALRGKPVSWLVVGEGVLREELEREAMARGLTGLIRFAGWRTDVVDLMAATDIVVQPTLHEALSQVMIEAMAMGRPLIISDVSGVRDIVEDGLSGRIVRPRDSEALTAAIESLSDPLEAARLGRNAYQRVRELLDARAVIPSYEQLYRSLAGANPKCQ